MSTPAKTATTGAKASKKRREHPLFTTNAAITSARQRLRLSPSTNPAPSPSPDPLSAAIPTAPSPTPRPDTKTANGAATFSTSGSACLDLFFSGVVRGCDPSKLEALLEASWREDAELTLQVLLHGRDCRGGKGERLVIQQALLWLRRHKPCTYLANLLAFLRAGYFRDLLLVAEKAQGEGLPKLGQEGGELIELELMAEFLRYDAEQLTIVQPAAATTDCKSAESVMEVETKDESEEEKKGEEKEKTDEKDEKEEKKGKKEKAPTPTISLAAKWAPTEKGHFDKAPLHFASRLARLLFPSDPRPLLRYRRLLSSLRERLGIVERSMCANEWEEIHFEAVPSKAHLLLRKAFARHQAERYAAYLADVKTGVKKIKSTGLQPHELTRQYRAHSAVEDETVEAQWRAVVEGVRAAGGLVNAMAVVDVSGSMTGGGGRVAPIDPAIALGLLVAQSASGPFADRVITFSTEPMWHRLPEGGSLLQRVTSLAGADWGQTTDLQKVFDLLLSLAVQFRVPQAELPSTLYVFSDMEFDVACGDFDVTNYEVIQTKYSLAGYAMPRVIFWNLSGQGRGNAPGRMNEAGVALLSGFSGELLKLVMEGEELSPLKMMRMAVSGYDVVVEEQER